MEDADRRSSVVKDPIVNEVRAAREAHAKRFGYDLRAIVRDLKKHERGEDREVVSFPAKRLAPEKGAA